MNIQDLFRSIDEQAGSLADFLIAIAGIESPSDDKDGVDAVADAVEDFAQKRGFHVERKPFDHAGDGLVIEAEGKRKNRPVALLAHMDTVHVPGAFGYPPVRKTGSLLSGPGVHDCKGGIAVALLAMDALLRNGWQDRPVKLVLVPDEEVSSAYSGPAGIQFIKDNVRGSAFALCCESGNRNGDAAVGRKGVLKLEVTVNGKAAHAGSAYSEGISAIKEAAHKIIAIDQYAADDHVTINCGVISGGTKPNIVPASCSFELDVRFLEPGEKEAALRHIERIVSRSFIPGTSAQLKTVSERIPMQKTKDNLVLCDYLNRICDQFHLPKLNPVIAGGGADSAYAVQQGVPTVCSVGIVGQYQHTLNEQADLPSLAERAKMIAAAIFLDSPFD